MAYGGLAKYGVLDTDLVTRVNDLYCILISVLLSFPICDNF